jgi:hypothetical protein
VTTIEKQVCVISPCGQYSKKKNEWPPRGNVKANVEFGNSNSFWRIQILRGRRKTATANLIGYLPHPKIKAPAHGWDRRRLKFKLGRVKEICGGSHIERLHVSCGIESK